LPGKVAFVAAGGSGIGRATALRFADEGACVAVNARHDDTTQAVVDEITSAGGTASAHPGDLTDSAAVDAMIAAVHHRWGRLDVLVNCGGARVPTFAVETTTDEQWHDEFALSVDGTFYAIRAALRIMVEQRTGSIVNIISPAAFGGAGGGHAMVGYGAAKAAVDNLTRIVAVNYGQYGIRVNAVAPATVETPHTIEFLRTLDERGGRDAWQQQIPLRRIGRPDDVANVVLFLASDEAAYVTGATYCVDGGVSAQLGSPRL
jgi:meso-butanediol dehydrogenase/(S,S)-butanediol dehydrogenase/diacetyl reductase